MAKQHDPTRITDYILGRLKKEPMGLSEFDLSDRYDPVTVSRMLFEMAERGMLNMSIDKSQVGGKRKIYRVKEQ
jgi:hypothetical protein